MTKTPSSLTYYCAICDFKAASRDLLGVHKKGWLHTAKQAERGFAAKNWFPVVALTKTELESTGVPFTVAAYAGELGNPSIRGRVTEKLDEFGRGRFLCYVPKAVANAIEDWYSLPASARSSRNGMPLIDYIRTMFAEADWTRLEQDTVAQQIASQNTKVNT